VTVSFGVRYLAQPSAVLSRLAESLAENGRLVVLDFVRPKPGVISGLAGAYFFRALPLIAMALGGERELYDTLVETAGRIDGPQGLEAIVRSAGLRVASVRVMGFGLVVGIVAEPTGTRSGEPTAR
jgi:demethylmenaquinone methyltransferase/2-methoxy-6-polyprenyl-1,4-benzoquinol methylase